ncbi:MAG: UDP-N-acetylenolpyruvoylglucosamine reductase, partial [Alphaproteobacteria bacterium]|nr:UDP-N-acetylenolpyruvoylglucosamine reductase [Alphaproteobacteria bacterium]
DGKVARLQAADLRMAYRHSELPPDAVCLRAAFSMVAGEQDEIRATMERMKTEKNASQPLRGRTGGSTFKNPRQDGLPQHAWQLIDAVGLRGHRIGGAHFSDKHCNFMMNDAGASAADLEHLGELARQKVQEKFGIDMEWEIKKVGEPA